jgi:hypothetical protein
VWWVFRVAAALHAAYEPHRVDRSTGFEHAVREEHDGRAAGIGEPLWPATDPRLLFTFVNRDPRGTSL